MSSTWGEVAVKVVPKIGNVAKNERQLEKLKLEINAIVRATQSTERENLVHTLGWALFEADLWLVMELVDCNLFTFFERVELTDDVPFDLRVSWISDVADGMDFIHNKLGSNCRHRHLNSNNVLLTAETAVRRVAKIGDFGLMSVRTTCYTQAENFPDGTTAFDAPEIVLESEGAPKHHKASDVYSFSMVMYHIMAMKPPFSGIPKQTLIKNVRFV